jgi:hypothetical protein
MDAAFMSFQRVSSSMEAAFMQYGSGLGGRCDESLLPVRATAGS